MRDVALHPLVPVLALLSALVLASCDEGTAPTAPAGIEALTAVTDVSVGDTLELRVRITDGDGNGVAGVKVGWAVTEGDGAVAPEASTTADDGAAATTWVVGGTAGEQAVEASVEALDAVTFTATAAAGTAATVAVAPDTVVLDALGDTASLEAEVTDAYGNPLGTEPSWRSLDTTVVTLAGGRPVAEGNGLAGVVAEAGPGADTGWVAVAQVATDLTATLPEDTLAVGDTVAGGVEAWDANGRGIASPEVAWSSSDTTVARVSAAGQVRGVGAGSAWIRAAAEGVTDSASVTVRGLAALVCDGLRFVDTAGVPLDTIALEGIPDTLQSPRYAEVVSGADTGSAFVERFEDGTGYMQVPVMPGGDPAGGVVQARVTGGTIACPARPFTIEPLPEASGAFRALVDSISALLDFEASNLGLDPAALDGADPDTLSQIYWPLLLGQYMIDGSTNPNSVQALLDGTAPALDGDTVPVRVLDGLLARTGAAAALQAHMDSLRDRATAGGAGADGGAFGTPARAVTRFECDPPFVDSAGPLDQCMRTAFLADFELEATKQFRDNVSTLVGAAGLIPGAGTISLGAGLLIWIHGKVLEGTARLLPRTFAEADFTMGQDVWLEDEAGSSQWSDAWVIARSDGWRLDATIVEGLFQALSVSQAYDEYLKSFMDESSTLIQEMADFVLGELYGKMAGATAEGSGIVSISPDSTPPVDISAEQWSESLVQLGDAIELLDHRTYEPRNPGTAQLTVRSNASYFPGDNVSTWKPVEVERMQVVISPDEVRVTPGETVELQVEVVGAATPDVAIAAEQGDVIPQSSSDSVTTVTVSTPTDRSLYPYLVTAEDTSSTGARAYSTERRLDQAVIRTGGQISIAPPGGCVEWGDTLQFSATVTDLDDTSVTWSASAGTVDGAGRFIAPAADAKVTVTATSVAEPSLTATATVQVREQCGCWWEASLIGDFNGSAEGDRAQFGIQDGVVVVIDLWHSSDVTSADNIQPDPVIPAGETALGIQATASGTLPPAFEATAYQWVGHEVVLDVLEHSSRRMLGHAYGTVKADEVVDGEAVERTATLDLWFYADEIPETLDETTSFCNPER